MKASTGKKGLFKQQSVANKFDILYRLSNQNKQKVRR